MKTRAELCKELGLLPNTLASRLWETDTQPSDFEIVKGQCVYLYDEEACTKIRAMFEGRTGRPGRPKLKKEVKP